MCGSLCHPPVARNPRFRNDILGNNNVIKVKGDLKSASTAMGTRLFTNYLYVQRSLGCSQTTCMYRDH